MKKIFAFLCLAALCLQVDAVVYSTTWSGYSGASGKVAVANGYAWCYQECDGGCRILGFEYYDDEDDLCNGSAVYSSTLTDSRRSPAHISGHCNIPSTLNGLKVVEIGKWAFWYQDGMTSVTIPDTVTTISESAFPYCYSLASVTFSKNLTSIGSGAFSCCSKLESISLPDKVVSIGGSAFNSCSSLKSISLSEGLKRIGSCAFYGSPVTSLVIPASVEALEGYGSLGGLTSLSAVIFLGNAPTCGSSPYARDHGSSTPPSGLVTYVPKGSTGWNGDESETLPSSWNGCRIRHGGIETANGVDWLYVLDAGNAILPYRSILTSVIGSVTIPNSLGGAVVSQIEDGAFDGWPELSIIEVSSGNSYFKSSSGILYDISGKNLICCPVGRSSASFLDGVRQINSHAFYGCNNISSLKIPEGVTNIGATAFSGCGVLSAISIPSSVKEIGEGAFAGCSQLMRLDLPDSVRVISDSLCSGCGNLTNVTMSSSVLNVGAYAFNGCGKLSSFQIPTTVRSLGKYAFYQCLGLLDVTIPSGVTNMGERTFWGSKLTNVVIQAGVSYIGDYAFVGCLFKDVFIPNSVKSIGGNAFYNCNAMTNVTISSGVTSIGGYSFYRCSALTSLKIPSSVTDIGSCAFVGCGGVRSIEIPAAFCVKTVLPQAYSMITNIVIPADTTEISAQAYSGCAALGRIVMPSSVTMIGDFAFNGCTGLTRVDITDLSKWCGVTFGNASANPLYCGHCLYLNGSEITALNIPTDVSAIADYSFYNASAISAVTIPASVTSIGANAFTGCTGIRTIDIPASYNVAMVFPSAYSAITQLTIPEGTTTIAANAYQGCSSVAAVVVPASVTTVGSGAFQDCSNLKSVKFKGQAPACGDNVFTGTSADMVVYAGTGTSGWTQWNGRPLAFVDPGSGSGGGSETVEKAQLTVTNVVIHYVVNSVVPSKVYPATYDTGFVNIITEVKSGGAVSVPATWMVNYSDYVTKFGNDFTKSLMKPTGKYDSAGNPMCVWQDYVAGTDPTDENDKFTASVTMVDGKPVISYTPELNASETALRTYKTWGKVKLQDTDWVEVPSGHESDYNFFKVTVEMK